jgi:hypothetical protein
MKYITLILLCSFCCLFGCGGGKFLITAQDVDKPVSASRAILDPEGNILTCPEHLEAIHHFNFSKSLNTMFWTNLAFNPKVQDISEPLNAELNQHNGDAVCNLMIRVSDRYCFQNIFGIIPIVPTGAQANIEGDVVILKVEETSP